MKNKIKQIQEALDLLTVRGEQNHVILAHAMQWLRELQAMASESEEQKHE